MRPMQQWTLNAYSMLMKTEEFSAKGKCHSNDRIYGFPIKQILLLHEWLSMEWKRGEEEKNDIGSKWSVVFAALVNFIMVFFHSEQSSIRAFWQNHIATVGKISPIIEESTQYVWLLYPIGFSELSFPEILPLVIWSIIFPLDHIFLFHKLFHSHSSNEIHFTIYQNLHILTMSIRVIESIYLRNLQTKIHFSLCIKEKKSQNSSGIPNFFFFSQRPTFFPSFFARLTFFRFIIIQRLYVFESSILLIKCCCCVCAKYTILLFNMRKVITGSIVACITSIHIVTIPRTRVPHFITMLCVCVFVVIVCSRSVIALFALYRHTLSLIRFRLFISCSWSLR